MAKHKHKSRGQDVPVDPRKGKAFVPATPENPFPDLSEKARARLEEVFSPTLPRLEQRYCETRLIDLEEGQQGWTHRINLAVLPNGVTVVHKLVDVDLDMSMVKKLPGVPTPNTPNNRTGPTVMIFTRLGNGIEVDVPRDYRGADRMDIRDDSMGVDDLINNYFPVVKINYEPDPHELFQAEAHSVMNSPIGDYAEEYLDGD